MKKIIVLLMTFMPFLLLGQSDTSKGIHFEHNLVWEQIKAKAKAEDKYIFVDCYATWCGPCKLMDKNVYPVDSVGNYMNNKFISVKVQLDTTKMDNEQVQNWYTTAHLMSEDFDITAMPTYLFYSPAGKIVHKNIGGKNIQEFIAVANDALDPNKQYYTLISRYIAGNIDIKKLPELAKMANDLKDNEIELRIAKEYMNLYLDQLNEADFFTKHNFDFIRDHYKMLSSKDRAFNWYKSYPEKLDSLMDYKGYAKTFINYIITKEEITPNITTATKQGKTPDWIKVTKSIEAKYGKVYAENNVIQAKVRYYKSKKDWKNFTKYLVRSMEIKDLKTIQVGMMGTIILNNNADEIFQYSHKKNELKAALKWIDLAITMDPMKSGGMIETKACILYKLGNKVEAIALEEKAIIAEPKIPLFKERLEKMKKGLSTWIN